MAIADLQPRQGKVDIIVEVVSMDEVREFNKFGKTGRVCNALVKDESGEIKLTLWNDDIDKVKPGMKLHIENGYVNEWQGEKQLTTGKFGKMEVVSEGAGSSPKPEKSKEATSTPEEEAAQEDIAIEEDVI
ncbi:DNA-binding protein [Candidatus Woesearchaeota archaeon]|nr:DNA-binding protein [Candidatus Woesearchaeota archaeon]